MPESNLIESKTAEVVAQEAATKEAEAKAAAGKEPTAEEVAAKEAEAVATKETEAKAAEAKVAELPEWARAELSSVRNEAAKYRISLRNAEAKLEGAKTPEEFATAVAELKTENVRLSQDLARTTAGTKFKLPPELVAVLKGDTPEALDAHAKLLSKFVPNEDPEHLSGGLNPNENDGAFDPVAESRKARSQRY